MVRGPVSMVIVGVIGLVMFGLVAGGPRLFAKILPDSAVVWLDDMGGFATGDMLSFSGDDGAGGDPALAASHLRDSSDGWKPDGKIAALPGGGAAFVDQVIAGYTTRIKGTAPAHVDPLAEVSGCAFTPPTPGAHIGHAAIRGQTGLEIPVATYGDADLAAAVQVLVNAYRDTGGARKSTLSGLRFEVFDIAVTETAKPVFLVLETGAQQRLFNLHLAPGARLERVILIGGDQTGVANLPPGVPVEAMRAETAAACDYAPFYPLNPGHLFYQSVENGAIAPDEALQRMDDFAQAAFAWEQTFRTAFGAGAAETLSGGWAGGTLATVGPLPASPEGRAVYAPIRGATLQVTVDQYVEFEGQDPEQGFDARVKAIATAFAWGDLKNLRQGVAW
jgi:hypothetical protein